MRLFIFLILLSFTQLIYSQGEPEYHNSKEHLNSNPPYSEAVSFDNLIYVSGQVGISNEGEIIEGGIEKETKLSLKRIKNILDKYGSSIHNVLKCTCILSDINDFQKMSEVYKSFFPKDKLPARTTFAGKVALGGKIEIDCIAKLN